MRSILDDPSFKYPGYHDNWESLICWDVDPSMSVTSQNLEKRLRRLYPQNIVIATGKWEDGIVWEDDVVDLVEGNSDVFARQEAEDVFTCLVKTGPTSRPFNFVAKGIMNDHVNDISGDSESDNENAYVKEIEELEDAYAFLKPSGTQTVQRNVAKEENKTGDERDESKGNSEARNALSQLPPLTQSINRQQRLEQLEREKASRLFSLNMFNKHKKDTGVMAVTGGMRRKRVTAADEELEHSFFAARHYNTTATLSHLQLKYFHRPTLSRQALSPMLSKKPNIWHIHTEKKRGKHKLTASQGHLRRTHNSTKQISTATELSLVDDTSEYICIEYIEEYPNLIMNRGMSSKIVNYYRPVENIEGDEGSDVNAAVDGVGYESSSVLKIDGKSSGEDGNARNSANGRRVPRHMQRLISGGGVPSNNRTGTNVGDIDVPKLKEGVTEVLEKGEDFPFLGEILPGTPPQPALHCELFRAPLFSHEPQPTDFLLVRKSGIGGGACQFVLKSLPVVFTSGQQEPLKEVSAPRRKKTLTTFQSSFMMFHITKYFEKHSDIDIAGVQKEFKFFWDKFNTETKKALNRLADKREDHDDGTITWIKKAPLTARQIQAMRLQNNQVPLSIDDYINEFSPEDVCVYEAGIAAEYRLSHLGLNYFMSQKNLEQILTRFSRMKRFKKVRLIKIKKQLRDLIRDEELRKYMPRNYKLKGGVENDDKNYGDSVNSEQFSERFRGLNLLKNIAEIELKRLNKKIRIVRYINEISLLTPWVLTNSFVKNHVEEQNKGPNAKKDVLAGVGWGYQKYSGLLRLRGIPGDPSGVGEGYSYLNAISKKTATKKDGGGTASIVGTGKDLRVLSMKDLETICVQLGNGKDEIKRLKRWDRVRVIEYAATEAKKLGLSKHLWRYAREEKEGTQNLEEYKQTCVDIWNRQVRALRDFSWGEAIGVENDSKQECLRRWKRKQRKEKRAAMKAKLEEDQKKDATNKDVNNDSKDNNSLEESNDIDNVDLINSDSSSCKDSESSSDSESEVNTDDDDDIDEQTGRVDDPVPVPAVASRRTKKAMARAKLTGSQQEEKPMSIFDKLSQESITRNVDSNRDDSAGVNGSKSREDHERFWTTIRQRGGKVVKRVTRRFLDDGTEKIEVRFIMDPGELERVLNDEHVAEIRKRRLQQLQEEDIAMGRTPRRGSRGDGGFDMDEHTVEGSAKKKRRKNVHVTTGDKYEDEHVDEGGAPSLTLKVSAYLNKAEKHSNKVARLRAKEELQEEREYARFNKKAGGVSRQARGAGTYSQRSTVSQLRHPRLPHVLLAANQEMILCSIWNKKISAPFRAPVDLKLYPDYAKVVEQPICLQDIRDKIAAFSYHTMEGFVNDLKLMVSNSVLYSGDKAPITMTAKKLYEEAIRKLAVEGGGYDDKDISLMGKDSYGFFGQENDIKAKFASIGRIFHYGNEENDSYQPDVLHSSVPLPPPASPVTSNHSASVDNPQYQLAVNIPPVTDLDGNGSGSDIMHRGQEQDNITPNHEVEATAESQSEIKEMEEEEEEEEEVLEEG